MKFCNYCDNMLYPKVDDTFKNYCKNCNTEFEREDKCVYKQNYDKKTYSSLSYIMIIYLMIHVIQGLII